MRHLPLLVLLLGCGQVDIDEPPADAPTWSADAGSIITERCSGCHQDGDIAPFPLTTFEEVSSVAALVRATVDAGTMPPWQPDNSCRDYEGDISLSESERQTLLDWVDGGTLEGEAGVTFPAVTGADLSPLPIVLEMSEPYTPDGSAADDYRCFVIDWPETEAGYVIDSKVFADTLTQVHHVLAYRGKPEDADKFYAWDADDDGPGYSCFGAATGPGGGASTELMGAWVPGIRTKALPAGTGIYIEPGSVMVLQMHYNTLSGPVIPDNTSISFTMVPTVEHEAVSTLVTDALWTLGQSMSIPAGKKKVVHEADVSLPDFLRISGSSFVIAEDETVELHRASMHMHQLGQTGSVSLIKADGSEQCLLVLPKWDFNWQGGYRFKDTVLVEPGDKIRVKCEWDNSAENQPYVDGVQVASQDTFWGDGTRDEMCLSGLYLSRLR